MHPSARNRLSRKFVYENLHNPSPISSSRAGKSKSNKELLSVKKRLSTLADSVLDGSTDKAVGAGASQILNVYLRALETERKWKELGEIEERIGALEEQARSQGDNRRWG
jgi:hypothetical protein